MTTSTTSDFQKLMQRVYRFSSLKLAQEFSYRASRPYLVMLGDDGYFWAAPGGVAAKLEAMGYEYAE